MQDGNQTLATPMDFRQLGNTCRTSDVRTDPLSNKAAGRFHRQATGGFLGLFVVDLLYWPDTPGEPDFLPIS